MTKLPKIKRIICDTKVDCDFIKLEKGWKYYGAPYKIDGDEIDRWFQEIIYRGENYENSIG